MGKLRYKQYLILYGGEIIEFEGEAARRKPCDGGPAATRTKDYQPELDTWLMSCLS
ncbi:hypothetical protein F2Q69_00044365 [Brassica cretica]|uniref:Uncharacterized protein n=1 Tax=Brassica cretica TaxID=69181 RepID=A0A8S9NHA9_BRACR|nr:hypothetical protein F2Q69_00044365 [Brassica cretica]